MKNILIILTVFLFGCASTSKITAINLTRENNKDVFILGTLLQDHLRRTENRNLNLDELVQNDTLKRITNNFEKLELKYRGGYISVYFVFSKTRNNKIELTEREQELLSYRKFLIKEIDEPYDGEIRLEYGERFYHLKKMVLNGDRKG